MSPRVLILACSASKTSQAGHAAPAVSLYDGPAWRTYRKWARNHPIGAMALSVYALSAKYGLVPAHQRIEPYDQLMDDTRVDELRGCPHLLRTCDRVFGEHRGDLDVLVFGGPRYCRLLEHVMPDDLEWRRAGDEGRGIGDQLAELKTWLETSEYQR